MSVLRRGACPGLTNPMQTGDGMLVRLSPADRTLSLAALRGIAEAAAQYGNGVVEITSRGSLQARGFSTDGAARFADAVTALGIGSAGRVPVEVSPLAGLDPEEIADPRPLAGRIRDIEGRHSGAMRSIEPGIQPGKRSTIHLPSNAVAMDSGLAAARRPGMTRSEGFPQSGLAPKITVIVDGGGRLHLGAVPADIRLTAVHSDAGPAWRLAIGGDAASASTVGLADEVDAAEVVQFILDQIAALGPTARGRDLDAVAMLCLLQMRGVMAKEQVSSPARSKAADPIGIHPLRDAKTALGIALPLGHCDAGQLSALADAAQAAGAAEIRLTPRRALLVVGLAPEAAAGLREKAETIGFLTDPADLRRAISACAGAPACASAHLPTRALAAEFASFAEASWPDLIRPSPPELLTNGEKEMRGSSPRMTQKQNGKNLFDGSVSLHLSGCAKGCAGSTSDLTLVGREDGCHLVLGGSAGDSPVARVEADNAATGLRNLVALVQAARQPGETTRTCLARLGARRIAKAFGQAA